MQLSPSKFMTDSFKIQYQWEIPRDTEGSRLQALQASQNFSDGQGP